MDSFKNSVLHAMLPHIILTQAASQPTYGYTIITLIRKKYGVYLGPSAVYPVLGLLRQQGLVKSEWNLTGKRPRRIYTITPRGHAYLTETNTTLNIIIKTQVTQNQEEKQVKAT